MTYSTSHLSFRATKQFSEFVSKYQEKNTGIENYISGFPSIENFKKQIVTKQNSNINRDVLANELLLQYQNIEDNNKALLQIEALRKNNCYTVTTGHQCCLFTGPLYFIYKIISTINLAKKLNSEITENIIIPVFWMATEDHDFEEIRSINLLNKKIDFDSSEIGNAVGRIPLKNIEKTIIEIEDIIQNFEYGTVAITKLKNAYQASYNIADATRVFVNELFKNDGLLIIDADNKVLKNEFKSLMSKDISNNNNLQLVESYTNTLLHNKIIEKAQISPRLVNLFLLDNNKRLRIDKEENLFSLKDISEKLSNEKLMQMLETNPEKFSPNVVMRPLYQETILPNLAYIGGGAEISYWMQLKDLFEANNMAFPILMIRNSVLVCEKGVIEKFTNLGFSQEDIFDETQLLQKKYLKANTLEINFESELESLLQIFHSIKLKATAIDKTLESTVEAEFSKTSSSIKNIENKITKAQKRGEDTSLNQIEKVREKYFPNHGLQERHDNFLYYFSKYGEEFLELLKKELDPLNNEFTVIKID